MRDRRLPAPILLALPLLLLLYQDQALAQALPKRILNQWGMEFILVPAGSYRICGGPEADERTSLPDGLIDLPAFYLQATEVTQEGWNRAGVDDRFSDPKPGLPAWGLSHGDAENLAARLNRLSGRPLYRLPREAEWEAACRAGGEGLALDTRELEKKGWVRTNSGGRPHPVAGLEANQMGFYDLLGNLYEWCQETYDPKECPGRAGGDPKGPTRGLYKVLKGGSFNSLPPTARCGWRFFYEPTLRHPQNGARLVREALPLLPGERGRSD